MTALPAQLVLPVEIAVLIALVAAAATHWFAWEMRKHAQDFTVIVGGILALWVTGLAALILPFPGSGFDFYFELLIGVPTLWGVCLLTGALIGRALEIPLWKVAAGGFAEMGLGYLILAAFMNHLWQEGNPSFVLYFGWTYFGGIVLLNIVHPLLLLSGRVRPGSPWSP